MDNVFNKPLTYLKGVGPEKAELLKKELELFTYKDVLLHFPFRYQDRSRVLKIEEIKLGLDQGQFLGKLIDIQLVKGANNSKRLVAWISDGTSELEMVWFQQIAILQKYLEVGKQYLVYGRLTEFKGKISMSHPELNIINSEFELKSKLGLSPVYPLTEKLNRKGMDSSFFQKMVAQIIEECHPFILENLSVKLKESLGLISRNDAFRLIHLPLNLQESQKAVFRIKFEELFFNQLGLLKEKKIPIKKFDGFSCSKVGQIFNDFYYNHLPYQLTNAQKRVIKEIYGDLKSGHQLNRLIQGDVGSGKTIVALLSMLIILGNNGQACFLAPTEILATQHFLGLSRLLDGLDVNIELLTGSTKTADRKKIGSQLLDGSLHILVGTHAILEDWVEFKNLGMAVIDEQHKFGVAQRAKLWNKNQVHPHILVMTATPIPRTLAMTIYGDLDVSVIDELPPGRKDVETHLVYQGSRLRVIGFMKEQIKLGKQVYVVYPLIAESEKLDLANLIQGAEAFARDFPEPEYLISIVHGKLGAELKEFEMQRFKVGKTQILISTTVIEVGVDVPNATVMIIENAERFGLSQLHQLRGRVGRGGNQSFCFLMAGEKISKEAKDRLSVMVETNDGFKIAERDMQIRGPGEMAGTKQSGQIQFKLADLTTDQDILSKARASAIQVVEEDPELNLEENQNILKFLNQKKPDQSFWSMIS